MNVEKIRQDFPILSREVYGMPLVYLDNAATTQKPKAVLDRVAYFYNQINGNIHRGVHKLSEESTQEYENAREVVRNFINARKTSEVVFTSGTTASINLAAYSFGEVFVHSEKPFFYGTNKIRVDFYIFCPDGNFGVDIFFTENIRDLQKNINIKLDKYGDFKDKLYFVLDGGLITQ
ncbi:MAG TPA: aminotransferase class V-fold PLP-dependent enzyme, partial [Tenuifilaceae bacterium]|nr:aminotransferase class V-fold PLP-dependent enzyme [Tenuifilaceae bacterium]